jgi:hypothetical protein
LSKGVESPPEEVSSGRLSCYPWSRGLPYNGFDDKPEPREERRTLAQQSAAPVLEKGGATHSVIVGTLEPEADD